MKKIKLVFSAMALSLGVYLLAGFANDDYSPSAQRRYIKESIEQADSPKAELLEKMLDASKNPSVEFVKVSNTDGSIAYTSIDGWDEENDIFISGRIYDENTVSVFLAKDDYGITIDTAKGLYYEHENGNREDSNDTLTRGEQHVISFLETKRTVEKTNNGYIASINDDLNSGYDVYDENGNVYESHLKNSQGEFTSILIKRSDDVKEVYEQLLSLKDNLNKTDDIADIK